VLRFHFIHNVSAAPDASGFLDVWCYFAMLLAWRDAKDQSSSVMCRFCVLSIVSIAEKTKGVGSRYPCRCSLMG
jgi:hypothetical protein